MSAVKNLLLMFAPPVKSISCPPPFLELGPSPFLFVRLPKSNAGSALVLVNELDAPKIGLN